MDKIILRMDSGFFSEELLQELESYDNVIYEVGVLEKGWLKPKIRVIEYKSYHGSEREYASFGSVKRRYMLSVPCLNPVRSRICPTTTPIDTGW
ncbi:MAG: hypothetical protein HQ591_01565 [candidate division Zixibacteria bacterium]|nr:hypothetical protein [Candidatus Tariuqbacter arcticus]